MWADVDLNGIRVSHLMWADDLVLRATDVKSLQRLLDFLGEYIDSWELETNMDKTNIMGFNLTGNSLKRIHQFTLNENKITPVRSYC